MSSLSNQSLIEMKNIIAEISLQAAKIIMKNIQKRIIHMVFVQLKMSMLK